MTYGRGLFANHTRNLDGAVVSHSAELVRGDFFVCRSEGPLIRPSCWRRVFDTTGTLSPRGEGTPPLALEQASPTARGGHLSTAQTLDSDGPLIRPSGTFSPKGEGTLRLELEYISPARGDARYRPPRRRSTSSCVG